VTDHATAQNGALWQDPMTVFSAAEIADADMRDIYDYWCGLRRAANRPRCEDFDVLEVPRHLLPNVYYLEYLIDEDDFLQRVLGTQIEQNIGLSMTGKLVSELDATGSGNLVATLRFVVETGKPCLSQGPYYGLDTQGKTVRRISLPLFRDGAVRIVFGVSKFEFDHSIVGGERGNHTSFHRST